MLKGHCHCESVHWVYPIKLESVTACNCTLCRRYGALWAYGYLEEGVTISGDTQAYGSEQDVTGFHFCSNCGCLAYYLARSKDSEGRLRIAVNLRMIDDPSNILNLPIDHFDGLDKFDDEPRDDRTVKHLWY
jgi:hypothetical protein